MGRSVLSAINLSERATVWPARIGAAGLAIMMFLTLADVVGRAFDHPVVGAVEVIQLIMGMMIYLGVGYTTHLRGHIRVDILLILFSPRVQAVLDVIVHVIAVGFVGTLVWRLFIQAASKASSGEITTIWEIPFWPIAYVMAAAGILMVTSLILHLVLSVRAVITGEIVEISQPTLPTGGE